MLGEPELLIFCFNLYRIQLGSTDSSGTSESLKVKVRRLAPVISGMGHEKHLELRWWWITGYRQPQE